MKMLMLISLGVLFGLAASASWGGELKVGAPAPEFELAGSDGKKYKLADFKNEQVVVLAWFPKAFTGG